MERNPFSKIVIFAAAMSLLLIAAVLFSRRIFSASLEDLVVGEASVYAGIFSACIFSLSSYSRHIVSGEFANLVAPVLATLGFLAFAGGLSTEPLTLLIALLAGGGMAIVVRQSIADTSCTQLSRQLPAADISSSSSIVENHAMAVSEHDEDYIASFDQVEVRLTRGVIDGLTKVEGFLSFECLPMENVKHLHIPIWPPLPAPPTVQATLEGFNGRVRVTLTKTYGVRIEVRRIEEVDCAAEGVLHVIATSHSQTIAA